MQVEDDGQTMTIELSGHDSKGKLLPGMLLRIRCESDGCYS